jgi:siroheme synthase (precorrin-2 oxidase/ferrochelatase)
LNLIYKLTKKCLKKIHGCGDEAKKKARAHIKKSGNLNVNEAKSTSSKSKLQHKIAEKKVKEKIEEMKAARTGTSNKK